MIDGFIDADAARDFTRANNKSDDVVKSLVVYACKKIKAAAERGEYVIFNPFVGLRLASTNTERLAAHKKLIDLGYEVAMTEADQLMVSWAQEKKR